MNRILLTLCAGGAAILSAAASWTAADTTPDGALVPSFHHEFTEAGDFDGYTILDLDGQGGWKMEEGSDGDFIPCVAGTSGYYNVPPMNDWLITPKLWLEAGKVYRLTVDMSAQSNISPERFEVRYGTAATVDGLTTAVIEPTEITNIYGRDFDGYIEPETSGEYYVGVHGMSDPGSWRLYCYSITIGEGTDRTAPGAVTNLQVIPDPQWEMAATVKFTAPSTDMKGDALTAPVDVDIWRSGVKLGTLSSLAAGSEATFVDDNSNAEAEMSRPDTYEYTVIPRNASGEGYLAKASNYIGPNVPGDVTDIRLTETDPGMVRITWTAPSTDKDGNPVPADKVSYIVTLLGSKETIIEEEYPDTELEVKVCEPDDETFACVRITARTSAGSALGAVSPIIPVGIVDKVPYLESFGSGRLTHLTGTETVEQTGTSKPAAMICIDADMPSVGAADGDDGFACGRMPATGDKVALFSGKIDLSALSAPLFALNVFKFNDSYANTCTIQMRCPGEEYTDLAVISLADYAETGWHKTVTPVPAQFIGKTVQYRIVMENVNSMNSFIDRVFIFDRAEVNLSARKMELPEAVATDEPFTVAVTVDNFGETAADTYTVELLRNGEKVDEKTVGEPLAPDAFAVCEFSQILGVTEKPVQTYAARVVIAGDEFPGDDETPACALTLNMPTYPLVMDLEGTSEDASGIVLTWSAVDLEGSETEHVVMDFENFDDHATDLSPFTTHDGDGLASGTYTDVDIPGITGEPASWYVIDSTNGDNGLEPGNNESNKFAMAAYTEDEEAEVNKNDDWLITPELYGGPQVMTFYVRCRSSWDSETLEVLTSTTDNNPESFELYGELSVEDAAWKRITIDVADGVRYVALRYTSEDQYYVAVDDIEYAPAGGVLMLQVLGYNVYRNGMRLNDRPLTATTFTDSTFEPDTDYTYAVTAVYNRGESALGNTVSLKFSSVEVPGVDGDAGPVYYNLQGMRVSAPVEGGIYIRRIGHRVDKVVY